MLGHQRKMDRARTRGRLRSIFREIGDDALLLAEAAQVIRVIRHYGIEATAAALTTWLRGPDEWEVTQVRLPVRYHDDPIAGLIWLSLKEQHRDSCAPRGGWAVNDWGKFDL
ncbi:hypothetical protein [Methylohalobius crimeensis]|uniref:hypothetical protein n=1 Tax=Methylohalobius crimeensis TaxID=244365 RepID=UPI0003B6A660|nr:hypothetical protein [Methylohalobius crimeensis]